jgi:AmmeMemoRadiSam system protein A
MMHLPAKHLVHFIFFTFMCIQCGNGIATNFQKKYPPETFDALFMAGKSSILLQFKNKSQKEFRHIPCSADDTGVFVRLIEKSEERGCIGFIRGVSSTAEAVAIAAVDASFFDPRFAPLKVKELPDIEIEITIIDKLMPIAAYDDFQLGRHTIYLRRFNKDAIMQGQIAFQKNFSKTKYLEAICRKAGLDRDAYKKNGTELFRANTLYMKKKFSEINIDK